jgi:nucleotide-binding universal stress UspA family protein
MRHIMVATDGSRAANRAIGVAAKLAKVFGGKLLIVTVDGPLPGKDIRQFARPKGDIGNAFAKNPRRSEDPRGTSGRDQSPAEVRVG